MDQPLRRHPLGVGERLGHGIVGELLDQPELVGLTRVERGRCEAVQQGGPGPDEPGHPGQPARAGNDAEPDLDQAVPVVTVLTDPHVGGEGELEPPAHGVAVQGGDHRERRLV